MLDRLFRKGLVIGIIILFIGVAVFPSTGTVINKNTKLEEQQILFEENPSNNGDGIDWWPTFQHDPQNTGYTTSKAPNTDNILWSFEDDNGRFNSPIVMNNKIIVATWGYYSNMFSGRLYCLDAETGGILWIKSFPEKNVICAAASADNEKIYISPNFAEEKIWEIIGYDVEDGSQIWKKKDYGYTNTGTTIVNNKLFLCGGNHMNQKKYVYCLDKLNGNMIWNFLVGQSTEHISSCCPAFVDDKLIFCSAASNPCVWCLNASSGEKLWKWKNHLGHGVQVSPAVVDGRVYFGSHGHGKFYPGNGSTEWIDGAVFCVDAENGTTIWQSEIRDSFTWSAPAVYNHNVYICSKNYKVYCFDAESGDVVWDYTIPNPSGYMEGPGPLSPAVADGKVYISAPCRFRGRLYCFDAYTGDVIWEFEKPGWLSVTHNLAIADGKVITGFGQQFGKSGFLYCFSDIDQDAPNAPSIEGPTNIDPDEEYEYSFVSIDPNGDDVYYYITWDDGTIDEWIGPYSSGKTITVNHTWSKKGKYEIRARAKDTDSLRGPIGILKINKPRNRATYNSLFLRFLEQFPILHRLLSLIRV